MSIPIFPLIPQSEITLMFNFVDSVNKSLIGTEMVQCPQVFPKLSIKHTYKFRSFRAERIRAQIYKNKLLLLPLWYQAFRYEGTISSGSTALNFGTLSRDFSEAGMFYITDSASYENNYDDPVVWESREIDSITQSSISFSDPLRRDYINPIIVPLFEAFITVEPQSYEYPEDGLTDITIDFTLRKRHNLYSALIPGLGEYNGYTVLTKTNYFSGNSDTYSYATGFENIDLNAGIIRNRSDYKIPQYIIPWGFFAQDYLAMQEIISFILRLKGRKTLIYIPTYKNEFKISRDHSAGETYISVLKGGFEDFDADMINSRAIYLKSPFGTSYNEIDHITSDISRDYIHLKTPLSQNLTKSKTHICWLVLCRSASSYIQVFRRSAGNSDCDVNFVEVGYE